MENTIVNQNAAAEQPSVLDLLLGEKVTLQMGVGFAIIFAALLVSDLAPGKID